MGKRNFFTALITVLVVLLCCSCATKTKVITVPEVHREYLHTTDSVHHTDSIIREKETIVMQLDSAAMSRYGIRLAQAERAWLVKTAELERELQRIAKIKTDTVLIRDSIPYPVPTPVEVAKPLSWWQRFRMTLGTIAIGAIGVGVVLLIIKIKKKTLG